MLAAIALLLVFGLWRLGRESNDTSSQDLVAEATPAMGNSDNSISNIASDASWVINNVAISNNSYAGTITNNIQEVCSDMTTEEVVADLGNFSMMIFQTIDSNIFGNNDIRYWRKHLHRFTYIPRLIHETRKNPEKLLPLLSARLDKEISDYPEIMLALRNFDWLSPRSLSSVDPYYNTHKRYEDQAFDAERSYQVIYSIFYIYANAGYADGDRQLKDWISIKSATLKLSNNNQNISFYDCRPMDRWLLDVFASLKNDHFNNISFTKKRLVDVLQIGPGPGSTGDALNGYSNLVILEIPEIY
jgi:hypothetical protein